MTTRKIGHAIATVGRMTWRGVSRVMDAVVTTRVKHLIIAAGLLVFGFWGVLHQQATLSARSAASDRRQAAHDSAEATDRAFEAQLGQYNACLSRVATRDQVRTVLSAMVDLSDLFPGNAAAEQYTASRKALIDVKYPPLDSGVECGIAPADTTGSTP